MMIATPRGIRFVPSLRCDIRATIGARMYAIRLANTNGNSTERPRNAIKTTNSGNAQRPRNFHTDPLVSPSQVSRRERVAPLTGPDSGDRGAPSGGVPGGSGGVM